MDKFCGKAEAAKAKDGILAIYEAQLRTSTRSRRPTRSSSRRSAATRRRSSSRSRRTARSTSRAPPSCTRTSSSCPAAEAFYRFYKTAPPNDPDLPVALYNAAVSYKLADRPKTAISLFKEFTANPGKTFRESPYYLDAMRLQAASYQAAFDYDNAINTYLELYETDEEGQAARHQAARAAARREAADARPDRARRAVQRRARVGAEPRLQEGDRSLHAVPGRARPTAASGPRAVVDRRHLPPVGGHQLDDRGATTGGAARTARTPSNDDDYVQTFYDEAALRKKKGQAALAAQGGPGDDRRVEAQGRGARTAAARSSPASGSSPRPRTTTPRPGSRSR